MSLPPSVVGLGRTRNQNRADTSTGGWPPIRAPSYADNSIDLGEIPLPISYLRDFVERNVGTFRLTSIDSGTEVDLIESGTGAFAPCVYDGTGDTVGGLEYTGGSGVVTVELLVESDGSSVTGVGVRVTFDGPADVVFFQEVVNEVIPDDVNINDRCTPLDRSATSWVSGIAQSE